MEKLIGSIVHDGFVHIPLCTYFIVCALILSSFTTTFAQETKYKCKVNKIESDKLYNYVDQNPDIINYLKDVRRWACEKVKDRKLSLSYANFYLHAPILRFGTCRGKRLNPDYSKELKDKDTPDPIFGVYEKYCLYKDPLLDDSKRFDIQMIEGAFWLRNEVFCQTTRYISHSDSWIEVLRPNELDSVKRLEKAAISICDDLRDNKIVYNEAIYRWNTEYQWFEDHLPKEAARYYFKEMAKPLKELMEAIFDKF